MLPLILFALGLGVALTAYEFSPRAHERMNDYARALRDAHEAHRVADAHLDNAGTAAAIASHHEQAAHNAQQEVFAFSAPQLSQPQPPFLQAPNLPAPMPPTRPAPVPPAPVLQAPLPPAPPPASPSASPPVPSAPMPPPSAPPQDRVDAHADAAQVATDAAIDHVAIATEANQAAAQNTADAALRAKTEAERKAAADSAAKVLERERKIAAALASLGVGQCGARSFTRVTPQIKNTLLSRLHAEGMTVTGGNPWNIDTGQYDVKLRAVWDPGAQVLKLIVTAGKGGYLGLVTCDEIWKKIDPIMKEVIG